ncbi:MAG: rhomboid family intramembrane serine protease [Proteobacteria bacterium]|nr:rhomboid family intramembrane serine protease [Pseudomonadota bacterium]
MVSIRIGNEEQLLSWDEWEESVKNGRIPADALIRFDPVTGKEWVRAEQLEMYHSMRDDAAIRWRGEFHHGKVPILTALLIGVQVRIWWFGWVPGVEPILVNRLTNWTSPALEDWETWRMITMGLLHLDFFHILLNMILLAYTGWNLERALGRLNLFVLYFASVIGGSLLSMFGAPETISLGASGGVFGLFSASVVFGMLHPNILPERGRRLFGVVLLPLLVLMFLGGLFNVGTDNWSHFGGLVVGALLALVLDPVLLQRRRHWNSMVQAAVTTLCLGLMIGLAVAGPRIYPLAESEEAREIYRKDDSTPVLRDADRHYSSLWWEVPVGWRPQKNSIGGYGFSSPTGRQRSWTVQKEQRDSPTTIEAVFEAWMARVKRQAEVVTVSVLTPITSAGHEAHRVRLELAKPRRFVEWTGIVRGTHVLHQVWEVEATAETRLEPLYQRLQSRVRWEDPENLVEARLSVERLPRSTSSKAKLAEALSEVGQVDEALDIWSQLISEYPDSPEFQMGLLKTLRWYPDKVADPDVEWTKALERHRDPAVIVEIVTGLESIGHNAAALGLLEVAWLHFPGNRALKRARRTRWLPTWLDGEQHLPWDQLNDPITWAPLPLEKAELPELTIANGRHVGETLVERHQELTRFVGEQVASGNRDLIRPLLILKYGHVPYQPLEATSGLKEDVLTLQAGGDVGWASTRGVDIVGQVDLEALLSILDELIENQADLSSMLDLPPTPGE